MMEPDGGAIMIGGLGISMAIRALMDGREIDSFTGKGRASMGSGPITNGIRIAGMGIKIATLGPVETGAAITGAITGATTGNTVKSPRIRH